MRLTIKNNHSKCYKYLYSSFEDWFEGGPVEKLGQLEDVLEKYGIEDAKQLDRLLESIQDRMKLGDIR